MGGDNPAQNPSETGEVNQAPAAAQEEPKGKEMSIEDYKSALTKANAEAAKYRSQRNEYREDAEKFRAIQESEKTDLQKAQDAQQAAETRCKEAERQLKLVQVLLQYGISDENQDLLGEDPSKFEARAEQLQKLQAEAARRSAPPSNIPVEQLKPGASEKQGEPDTSYPSSWVVNGQFSNNKTL